MSFSFDELSSKEINRAPSKSLASLSHYFVFTIRKTKTYGRFRKVITDWLILLLNGKIEQFKTVSASLSPFSCMLPSKGWFESKPFPLRELKPQSRDQSMVTEPRSSRLSLKNNLNHIGNQDMYRVLAYGTIYLEDPHTC